MQDICYLEHRFLSECNRFIKACIAYYKRDNPIMSDQEFDILIETLEVNFDKLSDYHRVLFESAETLKSISFTIPGKLSKNSKDNLEKHL